MVISEQEGAGEYISIKQVWLAQINRCNEAISNYALKDKGDKEGIFAASSSVDVLVINLVDYGDCPIRTEFKQWWKEKYKSFEVEQNPLHIAELKLEKIIEILNKYQMLHDSLPRGYTNVTMEGVKNE